MKLLKKESYDYSVMMAILSFRTGYLCVCLAILACSKYIWDSTVVGFSIIAYTIVRGYITRYKPNKGDKDERL